jgi:hypothetical protein
MPDGPLLRSLLVVLTLLVAGCGGSTSAPTTTSPPGPTPTDGNEGGFGAPSRAPGEFGNLPASSAVTGTLSLSPDGCWYVELNGTARLAVFPVGFSLGTRDASELVDAAGAVYRSGDLIDGIGSLLPAAGVPGGGDGKWGNYLSFCRPETPEIVVFETMAMGWDPSALADADLVRVLEAAEFTEAWPCGRGWAASSADQRVGLLIYATGDGSTGTGPRIDLPDEDWEARVVVGTHLFAEHCNDAIEPWVAVPSIAASWAVVGGRLDIGDPLPGPSDPPAAVRAVLDGGEVDTGSGRIALPTIELINTAFNAFAG